MLLGYCRFTTASQVSVNQTQFSVASATKRRRSSCLLLKCSVGRHVSQSTWSTSLPHDAPTHHLCIAKQNRLLNTPHVLPLARSWVLLLELLTRAEA